MLCCSVASRHVSVAASTNCVLTSEPRWSRFERLWMMSVSWICVIVWIDADKNYVLGAIDTTYLSKRMKYRAYYGVRLTEGLRSWNGFETLNCRNCPNHTSSDMNTLILSVYVFKGATWWRRWLMHCATSGKVVGSIPHVLHKLWKHMGKWRYSTTHSQTRLFFKCDILVVFYKFSVQLAVKTTNLLYCMYKI